jgi:hypothetical protein
MAEYYKWNETQEKNYINKYLDEVESMAGAIKI